MLCASFVLSRRPFSFPLCQPSRITILCSKTHPQKTHLLLWET
jgi:hypothetical protein